MYKHPFWSEARLARVSSDIDAFRDAAFEGRPALTERKKRMKFAAQSCESTDVQYMLGRSVDYIAQKPEYVQKAISEAHSWIEGMKNWSPLP